MASWFTGTVDYSRLLPDGFRVQRSTGQLHATFSKLNTQVLSILRPTQLPILSANSKLLNTRTEQVNTDSNNRQARTYRRMRRGTGAHDGVPPPPKKKIKRKYFLGNYVKFGHFLNFLYIHTGKNVFPPQSLLSYYAYEAEHDKSIKMRVKKQIYLDKATKLT